MGASGLAGGSADATAARLVHYSALALNDSGHLQTWHWKQTLDYPFILIRDKISTGRWADKYKHWKVGIPSDDEMALLVEV